MVNISSRQFAAIKRIAQNLYPTAARMRTIEKRIAEYQKEKESLQNVINASEFSVMSITNNIPVLDIVNRVVETTTLSDGKVQKVTKWLPSDLVIKNEDGTYSILDETETASESELKSELETPTTFVEKESEVTPEELEDVSDRYYDARGMQTEVVE